MSLPPLERLAILETQVQALTQRLERLDDERTWLIRLVLGIIIAAVIGLVMTTQGGGV